MRSAPSTHRRVPRETVVYAAAAGWTVVPLLVLLGGKGVFNGGYGIDVPDLMQYMGFIRQAGEHVLIANPFDVAPDPHLFLDPAFGISGLAWKLGASIQFALLLWVPVTLAVLVAGFAAFVRRSLPDDPGGRLLALALALFFATPAMALASWLHWSATTQFGTKVIGLEMFAGAYSFGGGTALGIALVAVFLLMVVRILEVVPDAGPGGRLRYQLAAGVVGAVVMWIHPWQGLTVLVIVAALAVWGRLSRRYLRLALPVILTAAPLGYYFALSHTRSSWMLVSHPNHFAHFGWWLVLGLVPVLAAAPGYLLPARDLHQRILRIWPLAGFAVYLMLDRTWFYHAFDGLTLPLAVLAVQGWRVYGRGRVRAVLAAAAALAVTVPGMIWFVQQLVDTQSAHFFKPGEARALAFLDSSTRPGPVLAPVMPLGQAVPGFTGRQTYVGHYYWTPDYTRRVQLAEALFDGRLPRAEALLLVRVSRATFLVSDCTPGRVDLRPVLGSLIYRVSRFGCATVYEVSRS